MMFYEKHLWETMDISLTNIEKNIIGASITASNWETISKNVS